MATTLTKQFKSSSAIITSVRSMYARATSHRAQNSLQPHCTLTSTSSSHQVANSNSDDVMRTSLYHPRRAVMYVPTSKQNKVIKTTTLSVDSIVFDIEDGVASNQKEIARNAIGAAIATCRRGDSASRLSEHVVRVNGIDSGLLHFDLQAVFKSCDNHGVSPDAIMLPKVDTVEHIKELDLALSFHRPSSLFRPLSLYIITESPQGLLNLPQICYYGNHHTRHVKPSAVVFGSDDYLALMGGVRNGSSSELLHARQTVVTVARANGLVAIDMVHNDFNDREGLMVQAEEAVKMGYSGKQIIHPAQIDIVQDVFSPSQERLQWANGLITSFNHYQHTGEGAFVYEGQMIDKPLLLQAQNIVNHHNHITSSRTPH